MIAILIFWRILLWAGVAAAVLSAYMHFRYSPWKRSAMGKQLATYLPALAIVFLMTAINSTARGRLPSWAMWLELVVFTVLVVSMFWRLVLQWRWRPKKKEAKELNGEGTVLPRR